MQPFPFVSEFTVSSSAIIKSVWICVKVALVLGHQLGIFHMTVNGQLW